ncbi:unnamed protein product [Arabidopsis halleri]
MNLILTFPKISNIAKKTPNWQRRQIDNRFFDQLILKHYHVVVVLKVVNPL